MDKNLLKELLKEMFKSGEIKVELEEETLVYFSKATAKVIIDDETVYESDSITFPTAK